MKKIILSLCALFFVCSINAAPSDWTTVLSSDPLKTARDEKKLVLLNFTGSDWCAWCMKFKREVLSQPEFLQYAKTNLVLVELDFPRKMSLPAELKLANKIWRKKYGVEGYPNLVLIDTNGKMLGRQSYREGGPKAFIAKIEEWKTRQ